MRGWHDWIDLPRRVGDALAAGVLGARPGEVIACDSTTVNLYKLAWAALDERDGAILTDAHNFPTDRYVLAGLAQARGRELRLLEPDAVDGPTAAEVAEACAAGDVGLVEPVPRRLPLRRAGRHAGDRATRPTPPARSCCGICRTRPAPSR